MPERAALHGGMDRAAVIGEADEAPAFPEEELRLFLRALINWAMYEPPGEAVSGELTVEFTDQRQQSSDK